MPVGGGAVRDELSEVKLLALQLESSAVHAGVIEDVADNGQQIVHGLAGRGEVVALAVAEWFFLDKVNHAQHTIEWCT